MGRERDRDKKREEIEKEEREKGGEGTGGRRAQEEWDFPAVNLGSHS